MTEPPIPPRREGGAPTAPTRPSEEIAQLGDEIYDRHVRAQVEPAHVGRVVAIDVDSGCWAVADSELDAAELVRRQCSGAIDLWMLRAGHRTMASIGGGSPRSTV